MGASIVLGILIVIAVLASLFLIGQSNQAQNLADSAAAELAIAQSQGTEISQLVATAQVTLTAVADEVEDQRNLVESLRLASAANEVLQLGANPETAALLSVHALKTAYSSQAESSLSNALGQLSTVRTIGDDSGCGSIVAYNHDGRFILTGGPNSAIVLWNAVTGEQIRTFVGHQESIHAAVFSNDSRHIVTGGQDGTVRLWEVDSGDLVHTFMGHNGPISSVSISQDGRFILSAGGGSAMRDGTMIVNAGDRTVRLWDIETKEQIKLFQGPENANSVAFSPDEKLVVAGFGTQVFGEEFIAILWDLESGNEMQRFDGHSQSVSNVAFSPDGQFIVTGSQDRRVKLWDLANGEEIRTFSGHEGGITSLNFSPNGQFLLTSSFDDTARLWDVETGDEIKRFAGHTNGVTEADFSPDVRHVITCSSDKTVRIWSVQDHNSRVIDHGASVGTTSYSPDGAHIITGGRDSTVKFWDTTTGELTRTFVHNIGTITSTAMNADGTTLVTANSDNRLFLRDGKFESSDYRVIWVWNANTGANLLQIAVEGGILSGVILSPDSKTIISENGWFYSKSLGC